MKVLKFGGSTLSGSEQIKKVINLIKQSLSTEDIRALVFSAFYGVTDQLEEAALIAAENQDFKKYLEAIKKLHLERITDLFTESERAEVWEKIAGIFAELETLLQKINQVGTLSIENKDAVFCFGEILSCLILCEYLKKEGVNSKYIDAREIIKTDHNYGKAGVLFKKSYELIEKKFSELKEIAVVTGFIASTEDNKTTTLGRDGSDYTASILAAGLNVKELVLWKDVDGMMTSDPRKVEDAFLISDMTYAEAMEMSHFGARVIYPPTVQPVMRKQIQIRVKNVNKPEKEGTIIGLQACDRKFLIKGLSSIDNISLLRLEGSGMIGVSGTAERLFSALAKRNISVILITQASSEYSICIAIEPNYAAEARECVEEEFALEIKRNLINPIVIEAEMTSISIVGENMRRSPIITSTLFKALESNGVDVKAIAQGSSELNISVVVNKCDEVKALNSLHDHFFAPCKKRLNLFVVGAGLIGATLLEQIKQEQLKLRDNCLLDLRVIALANSKKMVFANKGLDVNLLKESLENSGEKMEMSVFVEKMKAFNLANSVFVDCTANEAITDFYEEILSASIAIVTPNKKANSGEYRKYRSLKNCAQKYGGRFLYETNVGAGLPVLNTLKDLQLSGDKIESLEAILSGTLSYIFNTFDGSLPFSEVVKKAKELGYTEPDPRDDLNGMDVARKILILARECGYELELKDIQLKSFLPEECFAAADVEGFFLALQKFDQEMQKKIEACMAVGKKLRYIASLKDGIASVELTEVDQNHAFYSMMGSDNIVSYKTSRYNFNPLVVKGPGAGAEVTAGGVFADIIRLAH